MLSEHFYRSVVSINKFDSLSQTSFTVGSGFFVFYDNEYYLVTNKHVVSNLTSFTVNFVNSDKYNQRLIRIDQNSKDFYKYLIQKNKKVDISILWISKKLFVNHKIDAIDILKEAYTMADLQNNNISEGSIVYLIGHPLNLTSRFQLYPLVRQGIIAQIRKMFDLDYKFKHILVDGFAFPGNSGGPVVLLVQNFNGTSIIKTNYLIGFTVASINANSLIGTSENIGITVVISTDHILECITQ